MDFEGFDAVFWIKFLILFLPFVIFIWAFAPSLKWKFLFSFGGIIGITMALMGKSINLHRGRR